MEKNQKHRQYARETKRAEVLEWYLEQTRLIYGEERLPERQCEDKKPYGDVIYWWLEPPIPGITNPRIKEYAIGDGWGLVYEPLPGTDQ